LITELEIAGFKSFRKVSLRLGGFNLFIGANASGKTNLFDALRVLQGIGYGFAIEEIFNGKPKGATSEVWEPIRGGSGNAVFSGADSTTGEVLTGLRLRANTGFGPDITYLIRMSVQHSWIHRESLTWGEHTIFDTQPPASEVRYYPKDKSQDCIILPIERSRPIFHQLLKDGPCTPEHRQVLSLCATLLSDVQFLDPEPKVLCEYATGNVRRMGEHGENFASVVKSVLVDEGARDAYTSLLRQLTPSELDTITILPGALQDSLFAISRNGKVFPAPVLSDGTLRFAAIAAALFQPDVPGMLLLEEIENGLHPTRLRLLTDLLKSAPGGRRPQVMATTHSPLVLGWLSGEDYRTTFLCKKDEETGASTITPVSDLPRFTELARHQPASELFATGWLEEAQ
jgi:energy-coupling factor transporter ATP-binding protein EcfA2